MKVSGTPMRTIWLEPDGVSVGIIDQTRLPHELVTARLASLDDAAHAIRAMLVRGAPLIVATAAYGVALAMRADASDAALADSCRVLLKTRPTAVNLRWALDDMRAVLDLLPAAVVGELAQLVSPLPFTPVPRTFSVENLPAGREMVWPVPLITLFIPDAPRMSCVPLAMTDEPSSVPDRAVPMPSRPAPTGKVPLEFSGRKQGCVTIRGARKRIAVDVAFSFFTEGCTPKGEKAMNLTELLAKFDSGELIGLVVLVGGMLLGLILGGMGIVLAFYAHRQQSRQAEILAALKQDMLNRGMSADEICTVLEAGCGVGAQTSTRAQRGPEAHFTSIDISADSLAEAGRLYSRDLQTTPQLVDDKGCESFALYILGHDQKRLASLNDRLQQRKQCGHYQQQGEMHRSGIPLMELC